MSRSDGTPWRASWRDSEASKHWEMWSLPRGTGRVLRRQWSKRQRQVERAALRRGREPEPSRGRHSVHYDYW
jgi:hypothetical protein